MDLVLAGDLSGDFSARAFCCHLRVPAQYLSFSLSKFSSHLPTGSLQAAGVNLFVASNAIAMTDVVKELTLELTADVFPVVWQSNQVVLVPKGKRRGARGLGVAK